MFLRPPFLLSGSGTGRGQTLSVLSPLLPAPLPFFQLRFNFKASAADIPSP